jgi:hypothetical protein
LGGVAAVVNDLTDLITTKIVARLAGKSVVDSTNDVDGLNTFLQNEFEKGSDMTAFEERFGVLVGDITVAEILGSAEAQKTRNAIDEAANIFIVMEKLGGYESGKLREAINGGKLSPAQEDALRKQAMAVSDNAKLDVTTNEVILTINAPPEVVEAVRAAGPGLGAALAAFNNLKKGKK